mgnify:CR=1 FL=1
MFACVERPVTEAQRSFDPSIFERQVTTAADIQPCLVSGSNQPSSDLRFFKFGFAGVWCLWVLPGVLTLTARKRLLGTATGAGPNGGCMRYCSHGRPRPGWRRVTDRFPITWTNGTDP